MVEYRGSTTPIAGETPTGSASSVTITDSGSYYTGTTVEAALQELGAGEPVQTLPVRNETGSTIAAGSVVYISGYDSGSSRPTIALADADTAAKMPAIGIVEAAIATSSNGNVVVYGDVANLDTSAYSVGDGLFVSTTAGAYTSTKPTGATDSIQKVGVVTVSDSSTGVIFVAGALRSNDVPNITTNKYWEGDANNHAAEVTADDIMANVTATGIDAAIAVATLATGSVFYGASNLPVAKDIEQVVYQNFSLPVLEYDENVVAADGQYYFITPASLAGCNLVGVDAHVATNTFSSGTYAIDIYNLTQTADVLSTAMTIDTGELSTLTAATPAVINTDEDDVTLNDVYRIDVTTIGGGGSSAGLWINLEFLKP